ncbi:MAG: HK97 gp10 family phage protein [Acidobacteriota bacterium]|nr:HK97 gp10 family phage protein [Acidobacteriota bacterium]
MSFIVTIGSRSVQGLNRRINRELRQFAREQRKRMRQAGNILRKEMRAQIRSGPLKRRTGKLTRHIRVFVNRVGPSDYEAKVGPTPKGKAFYGKFHEHGTDERRTKKGRSAGRLRARPFMQPTIDAKGNEALDLVGDSVKVFL